MAQEMQNRHTFKEPILVSVERLFKAEEMIPAGLISHNQLDEELMVEVFYVENEEYFDMASALQYLLIGR